MQRTFRIGQSHTLEGSPVPESHAQVHRTTVAAGSDTNRIPPQVVEDEDNDQFIWDAFEQATVGNYEIHSPMSSPTESKFSFMPLEQVISHGLGSSSNSEIMDSVQDPSYPHPESVYDQNQLASPSSDLISPFENFTVGTDHAACCGNLGTEDCPRVATIKKQRRREQNRKAQQNYAARKQATLEQLKFIVKSQTAEINRLQELNKMLMKQLINHPTYEGDSSSSSSSTITKISTLSADKEDSNRRGKEANTSENRRWSLSGPNVNITMPAQAKPA